MIDLFSMMKEVYLYIDIKIGFAEAFAKGGLELEREER